MKQDHVIAFNASGDQSNTMLMLKDQTKKIRGHLQSDQCVSGFTVKQLGPNYWACVGPPTNKCPEGLHFSQDYCIGYPDSGKCPQVIR